MTARSPQHDEAEWFTTPAQGNHRRYEALRAWFVDGLTYQQAADRFGYTRWAMINLVREWRAGKLQLFAPPRKPPSTPRSTAPAWARSSPRRGSAGCCAARPRPRAAPRPPLAVTPACPAPGSSTLASGHGSWS